MLRMGRRREGKSKAKGKEKTNRRKHRRKIENDTL